MYQLDICMYNNKAISSADLNESKEHSFQDIHVATWKLKINFVSIKRILLNIQHKTYFDFEKHKKEMYLVSTHWLSKVLGKLSIILMLQLRYSNFLSFLLLLHTEQHHSIQQRSKIRHYSQLNPHTYKFMKNSM